MGRDIGYVLFFLQTQIREKIKKTPCFHCEYTLNLYRRWSAILHKEQISLSHTGGGCGCCTVKKVKMIRKQY